MMFTIVFKCANGTMESEFLKFDNFEGADYWAEKEKAERKAIEYWVR